MCVTVAFFAIYHSQNRFTTKNTFLELSNEIEQSNLNDSEIGHANVSTIEKLSHHRQSGENDIIKDFLHAEKERTKVTLSREKLASFTNGVSFATHVSLLGIQITKLVDIDLFEYTTIVGSLGSMSTILILLSFGFMSRQKGNVGLITATIGHIIGTAVLSIPKIYSIKSKSTAVCIIAVSYALVLISFFITNLSCEVNLGKKSRENANLAGGKEMGNIKSALSVGKVLGSALVVVSFRVHPQLPLWTLEGVLILSLFSFSIGKS